MTQDLFKKYLENTYSGEYLLKQYQLCEYGIWEVRGEDPNPDLGGPHHQPFLGLYEGKLEDVVRYAVMLNGFWAWGSGGSIALHEKPRVTLITPETIRDMADKRKRREEILGELSALNQELGLD